MKSRLLAAAVLSTAVTGCSFPAGYLLVQGRHLLADIAGAKSADKLLLDPATDPQTRALLETARDIRGFAVDCLGLKAGGSFTRYREVDRDHLVDVVQACAELSFEPYLWRYPFVGGLPYRGYYSRADAEGEAARLKAGGPEGRRWDVIVRQVDSFSMLGLARDPLYSFMRRYSRAELAELIIHELAHATVFIRGQAQFNEEFATFVGEEGARQWLASAVGPGSAEAAEAEDARSDSALFLEALRGLRGALEEVYRADLPDEEKRLRKAALLARFERDFAGSVQPGFRTDQFRRMQSPRVNNAYLSLFSLYNDDVPLIREYFSWVCGGDIRRLIAEVRALARRGDVKEQMRRALG
jgi:predicted aminopeptidase